MVIRGMERKTTVVYSNDGGTQWFDLVDSRMAGPRRKIGASVERGRVRVTASAKTGDKEGAMRRCSTRGTESRNPNVRKVRQRFKDDNPAR